MTTMTVKPKAKSYRNSQRSSGERLHELRQAGSQRRSRGSSGTGGKTEKEVQEVRILNPSNEDVFFEKYYYLASFSLDAGELFCPWAQKFDDILQRLIKWEEKRKV